MLNFYNKLPDFYPVGASQRASCRVPTGPTYRSFVLNYSANGVAGTKALFTSDIEEVVVKVNGTPRIEISGEDLVMLNDYYGIEFVAGQLVVPLSREWLRTIEGEENLAWGTKNVSNIFIEVKFAAGANNPALSADAWVTPESRDLGLIVEIHNFSYEAAGAGKKEIADLPKENGAIVALHTKNSDITATEVKINKIPFVEGDTDLASYQTSLKRIAKRAPVTGYVHIDAFVNNRIDDAWPVKGAQEFRVNPTVSAAGSLPMIMETLNNPLPASSAN